MRPGRAAGRPTTASKLRLDVRKLRRGGRFVGRSTITWSRGDDPVASIGIEWGVGDRPECLWLVYRWTPYGGEPRDMRQRVAVHWTACNYGGVRPWFSCPRCQRRAAVLWGSPFYCRRCHGLVYASQNESHLDRAIGRSLRIRAKLGLANNLEQPVVRPKGMRERTWQRLRWELAQADGVWIAATARLWNIDLGGQ